MAAQPDSPLLVTVGGIEPAAEKVTSGHIGY